MKCGFCEGTGFVKIVDLVDCDSLTILCPNCQTINVRLPVLEDQVKKIGWRHDSEDNNQQEQSGRL